MKHSDLWHWAYVNRAFHAPSCALLPGYAAAARDFREAWNMRRSTWKQRPCSTLHTLVAGMGTKYMESRLLTYKTDRAEIKTKSAKRHIVFFICFSFFIKHRIRKHLWYRWRLRYYKIIWFSPMAYINYEYVILSSAASMGESKGLII